jgi:hypothetical protein
MTKARDLANIISGGFTEADIPNLSASKITSGSFADARIPSLAASKITSGTFADARIAASNVSQHATSFDDNKIVNDISTLALRQASNENKAAYNTNSMFVDVFQDSTGIASHTQSTRNSSEYVNSVSSSFTSPTTTADDILVLDSFGHTNGQDNFVDLSTGGVGQTSISHNNNVYYDNNYSLTGASVSIRSEGGSSDYLYNSSSSSPSSTAFQNLPSETNFTVEFWVYPLSSVNYGTNSDNILDVGQTLQFEFDSSENLYVYNSYSGGGSAGHQNGGTLNKNAWNHIAYVKQGSTGRIYKNGVQIGSGTARTSNYSDNHIRMMYHRSDGNRNFAGYTDLIRVTKRAVYPDGTSFTPANVWNYGSEVFNATGSFESNAITAPSSTSKMGAIITYQDQSGTNALNSDIVLKLSADNGSNYSTATLVAMPDFASGIKMAKVNDLSVTAGTQLKYKVEFANQSSGSKEARIRGVSLQY